MKYLVLAAGLALAAAPAFAQTKDAQPATQPLAGTAPTTATPVAGESTEQAVKDAQGATVSSADPAKPGDAGQGYPGKRDASGDTER